MIKDIKTISIGTVWNDGDGASMKAEIHTEPDFSAELNLLSPIETDMHLIRLKEGVSAIFTDFSTSTQLSCAKCLEKFTLPIEVDSFERHFLGSVLPKDADPLEVFLISLKDMTIDLTEAFRQEIILHFPLIPVCSERCQGLCPSCTVNLNHQEHQSTCHYQEELEEQAKQQDHKPLAQLKDLFKQ